jgi:hypothetical protein
MFQLAVVISGKAGILQTRLIFFLKGGSLMKGENLQHSNSQEGVYTEDTDEGISRMEDEGGGVVDQVNPAADPVLRNLLVDVGEPSDEQAK